MRGELMRWLWLILLTGTAFGQLATPTIALPSGTYVNMAWTSITVTPVVGVYPKICLTKDGTTPTATVAGTCDNNGSIWNIVATAGYGAAEFDGAGSYTLKVIATMAGQTNSAVATATYTVTSTPSLGLLTWVTPTQKITASSPGNNFFMPYVVTAPSGRVLVWYGYGAGAFDHGHADGIQLKYSDDNAGTWHDYAPSKVTRLVLTNIGSGYSTSSCSIAAGGGVTATCTAAAPVNGAIPSIALTNGGSGYDPAQVPFYQHPIICNVIGGGGAGATCQAWINDVATHSIAGVRMSAYGSGYLSTPTCSITQVGTPGNAVCSFGAPVNGAITSLTLTNRGTSYASPPAVTVTGTGGTGATAVATLNDCEPGDPANCFWHDSAYGNTELMGGGVSYSNTVIATAFDSELNWNSTRGPRVWRSLDNGANWEPSFNVQITATQTHSPANMLSIPPASPGVTGSCSTGCLIQWTTYGGASNSNHVMFSYDDGVNWGDVKNVPNNFPNTDEETAIAWVGGMKLIAYTRVGRSASNNLGWPAPLAVFTSSDLGTTWTQTISNLPTGPCSGLNPNSYFWSDQFTKPSGFVNPTNSSQFTFMYGERFACIAGPTPSDTRWRTVTFNMNSAFTGTGQNTPQPQIMTLDTVVGRAYGSGHTSYSGAWPMTNNKVLMAWEQAVSTTAEDIYVSSFSYPTNPLSIVTASPIPDGFDNATPYSYTLQASGGTPGYTWATIAGNLAPCGLSLSAAGVVSGATPIAGTCSFTAQVTDSVAATANKPFSVTIQHVSPPAFTTRISGGVSVK